MDTRHESELIGWLIGDCEPSRELRAWAETRDGRRQLRAYRKTLRSLDRIYRRQARVVHFDTLRTPVGDVFLAAGDSGLLRISFAASERIFCADLSARLGERPSFVRAPEKLASAAEQLREYFAGRRQTFDLPADIAALTPFQRRVLEAAQRIPWGRIATYGEIARRIGKPGASRAVGQALGRNPVPIVIPCHRVLGSGGSIGGYTGGLAIKRTLLELEGMRSCA